MHVSFCTPTWVPSGRLQSYDRTAPVPSSFGQQYMSGGTLAWVPGGELQSYDRTAPTPGSLCKACRDFIGRGESGRVPIWLVDAHAAGQNASNEVVIDFNQELDLSPPAVLAAGCVPPNDKRGLGDVPAGVHAAALGLCLWPSTGGAENRVLRTRGLSCERSMIFWGVTSCCIMLGCLNSMSLGTSTR